MISPLAGKPAPAEMLVDLARLEREYFERRPDLDDPEQRVSFGTSGHRGSSLRGSFDEAHILAVTQAICDYRKAHGTNGPLFMGKDTHALSGPAQSTALEVLAANHVQTVIQRDDGVTPTPVLGSASRQEREAGMIDRGRALVSVPFAPEYRASGVLLHVTSLPSRYGIGDLGPSARAWVDRLAEAGQSWWQSLPLGPTGYGNSPYQPLSTFAGNELLVSPEELIEDGLLRPEDCEGCLLSATTVDYAAVIPFKRRLLEAAWRNFAVEKGADLQHAFGEFCNREAHWLDDYALFCALKSKYNAAYYLEWPAELVERRPAALGAARHELAEAIDRVRFAQFLLCRQGSRLKEYANSRGLRLIGDLPFYVAADSSDVWGDPELFKLDERHRPRFVAGVPPDYFSAQGQLWGNPVYDWDAMRETGYRWCIDRFRALLTHVDMIRLDHFRGFAAAWHVPVGAATAQTGEWVPGPRAELFAAVANELGPLSFIAEDLGLITPDVCALRDRFHLPGMRVLQFAFDGKSGNPHLPANYVSNTVVYTGTHDNPTTRGWFEELPDRQRQYLWSYLQRLPGDSGEVAAALMMLAWSSPAALAMAPLQDILNLGNEARMNLPGRADGNWRWRCTADMLTPASFDWLRDLTRDSDRVLRQSVP